MNIRIINGENLLSIAVGKNKINFFIDANDLQIYASITRTDDLFLYFQRMIENMSSKALMTFHEYLSYETDIDAYVKIIIAPNFIIVNGVEFTWNEKMRRQFIDFIRLISAVK